MTQNNVHRQQDLYWTKMQELKVASGYVCRYRDYLGRWVTGVGIVRAVASSASIGAWVIWKQYAFIWGAVIACSQVIDALQNVFPVSRRHKAASELANLLEGLFIDAELEWANISAGKYTNEQIARKLHTLRTMHRTAEYKTFREGLARRKDFFRDAEAEAVVFFRKYGVDLLQDGESDGKD